MAPRLICALAALASAYDWTTPDAGLTPFNCTAFPNPIQVLLPDGQSAPYNVSELDLATGRYTPICPNGFPTTKKVNGFALMQYPATGPQGPALADKVYGFVCRDRKLQRFDCDSISQVDGNLVQQGNDAGKTCNAATFVGSTYFRVCCKSVAWDARRAAPSPFLSDVLYAFPAARNGGHFTGSPFAAENSLR